MATHRIPRFVLMAAVLFALACTCSTLTGGVATLSSISSAIPSALAANSTAAIETIPPRTPNPLTVHPTLDTAHAASNKLFITIGVNRDSSVTAKLTGGGDFDVVIPGALLTRDTDGSFLPAFGTAVTITPVSAIGGIPFSKGYLVALQITPEGLMTAAPGRITLDLPVTYNPTDLVGFAADAAGTNFHLYPIQASTFSGITNITIAVTHFSIYGVAQATQAEITAQQARTPQTTESQDDDLLAAPDPTKIRNRLTQVHDRTVKPLIDKLDNLAGDCNFVVNTAYEFEHWNAQVENLLQQNYFKDTINHDANILAERLKECLKKTCPPCLAGKKADKKNANTFIVQATFMEYVDTVLDKMDDFNKWSQLANLCAGNAGLPLPEPPVAACDGPNCGPTAVPPTCP
jgi:hypothetical protein